MRSIRVTLWVTLDGVVQGLGRPDEDTRGGFTHGRWGGRYADEVLSREMAQAMHQARGHAVRPPHLAGLHHRLGTLERRQPGHHAHERGHQVRRLEDGRGCGCLAELDPAARRGARAGGRTKAQPGGDLGIIGSASLVRSLHSAALIDHYTLLICPLTLGGGARLFEDPAPLTEFDLSASVVTTKGVIIAQYTRR